MSVCVRGGVSTALRQEDERVRGRHQMGGCWLIPTANYTREEIQKNMDEKKKKKNAGAQRRENIRQRRGKKPTRLLAF